LGKALSADALKIRMNGVVSAGEARAMVDG